MQLSLVAQCCQLCCIGIDIVPHLLEQESTQLMGQNKVLAKRRLAAKILESTKYE